MPSGDLHITAVSPAELRQLHNLSRQTFAEAFGTMNTEANIRHYLKHNLSATRLKEELLHPHSAFFFGRHEGKPVSYLKINTGPAQTEMQDGSAMEIERIYVRRDKQGMSIGQRLLDHALELALRNNMDRVWLGVWEENHRAISFYRRNGFEPFGRHDFMLGRDRQTDILMHRPARLG